MPSSNSDPAAQDRGRIKGLVLKSRLSLIETRGGPELVTRVLAHLSGADRKLLSELIVPVGWYPFEVNEALDRAIAHELGGGAGIHRQLGAQSAMDSLGSTHKNLIRSRDPHGLLKHSAQILRLYYDSGVRTYEWLSATSATLKTFDCKSFSAEDCQTNLGWHETAIGLSGGKRPRVIEPQCRARGDGCCEYRCEWE